MEMGKKTQQRQIFNHQIFIMLTKIPILCVNRFLIQSFSDFSPLHCQREVKKNDTRLHDFFPSCT